MIVSEIACDYNEEYETLEGFHAGTEYEIEDVKSISKDGVNYPGSLSETANWWKGYGFQSDGSLRNNGIEVITKPLTYLDSIKAFEDIHKIVSVGDQAYTTRTSIHVHVNVLPWNVEKVKDFVLLYALLEPVFFKYVGSQRLHNIHCVPLNYTVLPTHYNRPFTEILGLWSKYTAFNLLPVKSYGTVEFRHMYGTGDLVEYADWLALIRDLWEYTEKQDIGFVKELLMSGKTTLQIAKEVFKDVEDAWLSSIDFSVSTIDAKLAFIL